MRCFTISSVLFGLVSFLSDAISSELDLPNAHRVESTICSSYEQLTNLTLLGKVSQGTLKLPLRRPPPTCRTFNSTRLDNVLADIKPKFRDPDLAVLFENALTQVLDTSVRLYSPGIPLAFVTTGTFPQGWIKNATHQLNVYLPFAHDDLELQNLFLGVINFLSRYITGDFTCTKTRIYERIESYSHHLQEPDTKFIQADKCPLLLEDTAEFLSLSIGYYQTTRDARVLTEQWLTAVDQVLGLYERLSKTSLRDRNAFDEPSHPTTPSPRSEAPVNIGLLRDELRQSDDKSADGFNIPNNAMIVVQAQRASEFFGQVLSKPDLADRAFNISKQLRQAIETHAVVQHPVWGLIYAYEVDLYGTKAIMDDARVPSLLSMPYFGYTGLNNDVYRSTRKMILDCKGNPYFFHGQQGAGVGSPSTGFNRIWPMSMVSVIMSSESDFEIQAALDALLTTTSQEGLIHESFDADSPGNQTKPHLGWANSYFSEAILYLAEKKPYLIFANGLPYKVSSNGGNLASYGAMGLRSPSFMSRSYSGNMLTFKAFCLLLILAALLHSQVRARIVSLVSILWRALSPTTNQAVPEYTLLETAPRA